MITNVCFPISIRFEDGEVEQYADVEELITGVEDFDSEIDVACQVTDKHGRRVRLKLNLLSLQELSLSDQ